MTEDNSASQGPRPDSAARAVKLPQGPEVKRRRLRTALRQARDAAGLTQKQAADAIYWSQSKIVRIEAGTVPVAPSDIRAMLHAYGVRDEERIAALTQLAQGAREKGWDDYRDVYSVEAINLFANEQSASVIYKYEPSVIPGLLQTDNYARNLLQAIGTPEKHVSRKLEARLDRQNLLEDGRRRDLHFILDEAAVSRIVGDPRVMIEQLRRLQELRKLPSVSLEILPFSAGPHRAMGSSFTILQFDDPELTDVLYLENADRESIERDDQTYISDYQERFVEIQALVTPWDEFNQFIDAIIRSRYDIPSSEY